MSKETLQLLLPPGRMVFGNLYTASDKDGQGNLRLTREGKPKMTYDFGIAIPKAGSTHWAQTEWGKQIWEFGHKEWPNGQGQRQDFAWKIKDGDSQVPSKSGRKPCENTGWPGHWVVILSSSIAPRLYRIGANGQPEAFVEPDAIMPGDWIEAYINVASNGNLQNPGVYLNHSMVCFRGYDAAGRIVQGPRVENAGFGAAQVGASVQAAPGGVGMGAVPAPMATPPVTAATATTPPYTPAGVQAPAGVPAVPGAPPAPSIAVAPPAGPVMLPAANGVPYEAYRQAGWTDEQMRTAGYLK